MILEVRACQVPGTPSEVDVGRNTEALQQGPTGIQRWVSSRLQLSTITDLGTHVRR